MTESICAPSAMKFILISCVLGARSLILKNHENATGTPSKAVDTVWAPDAQGPPVGTPSSLLHYIDLGASFANTSLARFIHGYPHGKEFKYHLFEANPRVRESYPVQFAQWGLPSLQVDVVPAAAWISDVEDFQSMGMAIPSKAVSSKFAPDDVQKLTSQVQASEETLVAAGCGSLMDCEAWTTHAIDFASWLKDHFRSSDFVVAKIDIEGSEWQVLPHLLKQGAARLLDEVWVEWHEDDEGLVNKFEQALDINGIFHRGSADKDKLETEFQKLGVQLKTWPF